MKTVFFGAFALHFFLLTHLANAASTADPVTVTLSDGTEFRNCESSEDLKLIRCEQNGDLILLQAGSRGSFYLNVGIMDGEPAKFSLASVKAGDDILMESNLDLASSDESLEGRLYLNRSIEGEAQFMSRGLDGAGEEFFSELGQILQGARANIAELQVGLTPDNLRAQTQTGELDCERIGNRNGERKCGIYRCGQDEQGRAIFLANDDPGFGRLREIITVGPDGLEEAYQAEALYGDNNRLLTKRMDRYSAPGADGSDYKKIDDLFFLNNLRTLSKKCGPAQTRQLTQGIELFTQNLREKELMQYISMMGGSLQSSLFLPHSVPDGACFHDGAFYSREAFMASRQHQADDKNFVSLSEAQELFDVAKDMDLPWEYKQDGCYARAHLMARRFEEMGHDVDKAWAKGDLRVGEGDETIMWNYHVAPIITVVDESGEPKKYVIDPSIFEAPVPVDQWAALMGEQSGAVVNRTSFPFPSNASSYLRVTLSFSNSDVYWPTPDGGLTESEKLAMAKETLDTYQGYLDEND